MIAECAQKQFTPFWWTDMFKFVSKHSGAREITSCSFGKSPPTMKWQLNTSENVWYIMVVNRHLAVLKAWCSSDISQQSLKAISPSVHPPTVLPTVVISLVKFRCQLLHNYINSRKLDAILLYKPCTYTMGLLLSQNGLKSNLRASNFPGAACPQIPPSL